MKRTFVLFLTALLLFLPAAVAAFSDLNFEDFDDQDGFNRFSGDWNAYAHEPGSVHWSFDRDNRHGSSGVCLRVDYAVPQGGFVGIWHSLIGKADCTGQNLNFNDLYGDLKNSTGNATMIETVQVGEFSFWAKGNVVDGEFTHTLKVDLKDASGSAATLFFYIPNASDWTRYAFSADQMAGVDLSRMKEVVFTLADDQNDYRTSHIFLDDLTISTDETPYDPTAWPDDQFLDLVAQRLFAYFLRYTDSLGLALDRSTFTDLVSVGAVGYQLFAYCIGHQRGWADGLEARVQGILENLAGLPMGPEPGTSRAGYQGFFYHFLNAGTGLRKNEDVELSLYDTMLLMYGVLTAKEYFSDNAAIQALAQSMVDAVHWDWMVDTAAGPNAYQFHLGWKPEVGFLTHVDGYTDEALLVDVLALGSRTHPVTMCTYHARQRLMGAYPPAGAEEIAAAWTGSLFNYFFAGGWLDLEARGMDRHATMPLDIWENNLRATMANRQFCIDHADDTPGDGDDAYTTYSSVSWGLTACDNIPDPATGHPSQYFAFGALPTQQHIQNPAVQAPHLGTIAVYGAGSSILYLPSEAIAALRHCLDIKGLWSPLFGFGDAYSNDPHYFEVDPDTQTRIDDADGNLKIHPATWLDNGPWVNSMIMGVDAGPMLLAIENHRGGSIWNLTDRNPIIAEGLQQIFSAPTCPADYDVDRDADGLDLRRFVQARSTGIPFADLNCDTISDGADMALLASGFGNGDCP